MRHLRGGGEYITPNISLIDDGKRVYSEKKVNNEVNLITFTIAGAEYQAEEGMTWGEWVDSEYNVISAFISADGYLRCGNLGILTSTYNNVESNKLILHGESYLIGNHGGGDID